MIMKKFILLGLIALTSLGACKKDDNTEEEEQVTPAPDITTTIRRAWFSEQEKIEYYDAGNTKIFEQSFAPGSRYLIQDDLKKADKALKLIYTSAYTITQENNKNYFAFTSEGNTPEKFEVRAVDKNNMTWYQEKTNVTYTEGGVNKTAAKAIYNYTFQCPCP